MIIHTSYQVSFAQFSTMMKLLLLCVIVSSSVSDVFPVNGNKRHYPSPNRFIHPNYTGTCMICGHVYRDNGNKRHNPSPYRLRPTFEFVDIDGNKRDRGKKIIPYQRQQKKERDLTPSVEEAAFVPTRHVERINFKQILSCNDLENRINDERKKYGYKPLKCDFNMRKVARKHVENKIEAGKTMQYFKGKCNLHSWFGDYAFCYTRDHKNGGLMWNKPYELSKRQDKRKGYEISAGSTGRITAKDAMNLWKGSPGHYALIIPSNGKWKNLDAVGCWYDKGFADCWFAK